MSIDLADPSHAYLFGLLQTDGSHYAGPGNKGKISIEVGVRDVALLHELQRIVPYYTSVRTRTRTTNFADKYESATWTLCALEARQKLSALGLPAGRKSESIAPPTGDFSRADYLRGLIDGDGSIGFTARKYPYVSLVTKSPALAKFFCGEILRITGALRRVRPNKRDACFNIMVANDPAHSLAAALYYEGCLAMPRKLASARQIATWTRPSDMCARAAKRRPWTDDEDQLVLRMPNAEAAKLLDRTERSVNMRRFRLRRGIAGGWDDVKPIRLR